MTDTSSDLALLFATAQTQQQSAELALERLDQHLRGLNAEIRLIIRQTLANGLEELSDEAEQTIQSLSALHHAALPRVFWVTLGSAAAGLLTTLLLGVCLIPSKDEIAQRQATMAVLIASGAQSQLSHCTPPQGPPQLCIRVDSAAGPLGATKNYYLVHEDAP
jgi:hypothetical protein